MCYNNKVLADMAELADAYGSGPYESNFMQVQVLLSAPKIKSRDYGKRQVFRVITGFFLIIDFMFLK